MPIDTVTEFKCAPVWTLLSWQTAELQLLDDSVQIKFAIPFFSKIPVNDSRLIGRNIHRRMHGFLTGCRLETKCDQNSGSTGNDKIDVSSSRVISSRQLLEGDRGIAAGS